MTQSGDFEVEFKLHNALCQPLSDEELSIFISTSILKLDAARQIEVLRHLANTGRISLVQLVADQIAVDNASVVKGNLLSITGAGHQAMIFHAAGKVEKASEILGNSLDQLEQYRRKLADQQAAFDLNSPVLFADEGEDGIGEDLSVFSQALAEGDIPAARKLGQLISSKFVQRAASEQSLNNIPDHLLEVRPDTFVNQLQDIGLDQDALQVAILFLKERPLDKELLNATSSILEALGDSTSAIAYAEIAAAIDPDSMEMQKKLARLYTASNEFESAYSYWKNIVDESHQNDVEAQVGLAEAALLTGRNSDVISSCHTILQKETENSKAQFLLGMAECNLSNFYSALDHLNTAVVLEPENQDAWLKLADCYSMVGENDNSLDALRRASMSNPESVEINYSLADTLLSAGSPSEALPFLEKCVNLAPKNPETAVKLGKTLCSLGKFEEAEQILAGAFQKWPDHPVVATAYSDALLAGGKKSMAIKPMEVFVYTENAAIDELHRLPVGDRYPSLPEGRSDQQ